MQRLRGATGALMLSTALLIGSGAGAIATADTGTGDPTPRSSRTPDSADQSSGASSRQSPSTSARDAVRRAASGVGPHLDRVPSSQEAESRSSATDDDAAGTDGSDESDAAVEDAVDADPADEQPVPAVPTTVPEPALPVIETPTPVEPVTVPDVTEAAPSTAGSRNDGTYDGFNSSTSTSTSPDPGAAASGPDSLDEPAGDDDPAPVQPEPIIRVVTTMTTVVVSLGNAVAAVPPVILALPSSSTPVSDVITMLETVLASVTESAYAAARLPADLAALFGLDAIGTGPGGIVAPSDRTLLPVDTPAASLPMAPPLVSMVPEQSVGDVADSARPSLFIPAALASFSAPLQSAPAAAPPPADEHRSLIDRVFGGLLVPLSLWALATGALPGLAGLLVLLGAGVRVGYRQAKAGIAVRVAGIGRFAGPGPLGVVRAASLIALHQRKTGEHMGIQRPILGDQVA